MTNEEKAVELFHRGYSCAQSVYLACRDESVLSRDAAVLASGAFSGGVGGMEQSCGALCGAMMVLSERFTPLDPADAVQKQRSRAAMQAFGSWFEDQFGTCMCKVLKPQSKPKDNGNKACTEYVAACAAKLGECKAPFHAAAIAHLSPVYEQALAIRQAELRAPLGLDLYGEDLTHEVNCYHIGVYLKDELVGTLYLQPVEDGMQIRQVAVSKDFQGMGAGECMMRFAQTAAKEHGIGKLLVHSRKTAEDFYLKLGYTTVGDEFLEIGIPHVHMEKAI